MSLDLLCVAGFDGYWKRLNAAWTRTLGFTAEELMAVPLIEFCHPDDRAATLAARHRLMEGAPLPGLVNRYRCKDGSYRWFEWRSIANVERRLVYATARDVTADREAQRALHEAREATTRLQHQLAIAERMASIGTLAAGVAHEINNPLAYVLTNLELVREGLERLAPDEQIAEYIDMVTDARDGADRIRTIVRSLKTLSSDRAERLTAVELTSVLELAIEVAMSEVRHRARIVRHYTPAPTVYGDESRLGQVFVQLLLNAAQAFSRAQPDANEIRITVGTDATGSAFVELADNGPGIAPEILDRIFDPFFTTKPIGEGSGLGLSLCHGIVTACGGTITATNCEPHGASFRITLPAAVAVPVAPAAPRTDHVQRAKIVVIDDERSIGDMLRRRLRDHEVTAFVSPREALAHLLAPTTQVDVILSDVMMPDMSGLDLYEELRRHKPELVERVVFMSGGAFTREAQDALARVPNELVEKPFTHETLQAAFDRVLARR